MWCVYCGQRWQFWCLMCKQCCAQKSRDCAVCFGPTPCSKFCPNCFSLAPSCSRCKKVKILSPETICDLCSGQATCRWCGSKRETQNQHDACQLCMQMAHKRLCQRCRRMPNDLCQICRDQWPFPLYYCEICGTTTRWPKRCSVCHDVQLQTQRKRRRVVLPMDRRVK